MITTGPCRFHLLMAAWCAVSASCGDGGTGPGRDAVPLTVALQVAGAVQSTTMHVSADRLMTIVQELGARGLRATLFATANLGVQEERLLYELHRSRYEIALLSSALAGVPRDVQELWLLMERDSVDGCPLCNDYHAVVGFWPADLSAEELTLSVADSLGFSYMIGPPDSGICPDSTGPLPCSAEGRPLVVVPITAVSWRGECVILSDAKIAQRGGTAAVWEGLLRQAALAAEDTGNPLIVAVHDTLTGDPEREYLAAFQRFLDESVARGARFVTTEELVLEYATP